MGKAKPRHSRNRKHKQSQPTGFVCLEETELNSPSNEDLAIQKIIEEVQSSNSEEILCGLQSFATISEKPECVSTILEYKVLKIVAPMLIDKNSEIRNFTAGILRNLSASGSPEICERLVKEDIMTPLLALLQQYSEWVPESSKSVDTDTLLQVVNILWNLCESDDIALKHFNCTNLLNILLRCLDYETVGLDLSIAVCQCLFAVSEDNSVVSALRSHESTLMSLLTVDTTDNKMLFLKTLTAGIIVNLNLPSPWLAAVLAVIQEALAADARALSGQVSSQLPLDSETDLPAETQALLDNTTTLVDAQTIALEIMANLTASQDDEMDMDEESNSEDEEINGWTDADTTQPIVLSPEILEGLGKYNLVHTVLDKVKPLPTNVTDVLNNCSCSKKLVTKSVRLQCRAFLCLNNLLPVVDLELLGGPDNLCCLVTEMFRLQQDTSDLELLEAFTAATRASLLRLASVKCNAIKITPSDIEVMVKLGSSPEPRLQANVIRIVGTVGVLVAERDANMLKMVGLYLLDSAEKQQTLWLTAEAIDCLVDIFSEDTTDQVAADIGLVTRLQALAPHLKAKMRQERRTLGDHYPLVSTVMTNLTPFIKYKGARIAALRTS